MRIGAEQQLAGLRLGAEQNITDRTLGNEWNIVNTDLSNAKYVDQESALRNQAIALNRQQQEAANQANRYNRGAYINEQSSARAQGIADTRRQDEQAVRSDIRGQQQQANENMQANMAQRVGIFNARTGAGQTALESATRMYGVPGKAEKLIGGAVQAGAALLGGGG
jgi:hypothetical protein